MNSNFRFEIKNTEKIDIEEVGFGNNNKSNFALEMEKEIRAQNQNLTINKERIHVLKFKGAI